MNARKMMLVFGFLVPCFMSNIFAMYDGQIQHEQPSVFILLELPPELIAYILDELDCNTLCKISVVCKTFANHAKAINNHRQLGVIHDGTVILRDQVISLPLSNKLFFNNHLPIAIEGTVTIQSADEQKRQFPLISPCMIKSNATLCVTGGIVLELIVEDGKNGLLSSEDKSSSLVVSNSTIKARTDNAGGIFLNVSHIEFDGNCSLDSSDGMLVLYEGMVVRAHAQIIAIGQIKIIVI